MAGYSKTLHLIYEIVEEFGNGDQTKKNTRLDNMTTWTSDELNKIGRAEEIQVASLRRDGRLRNPVTIWVVRLGDDLYVRSVNGRIGSWFRGMQARYEGHIRAGSADKDVTFVEDGDPTINEQIDAAYRAKYRSYPSAVNHINSSTARAATIKLVPRP
jgi:hypothetical protein